MKPDILFVTEGAGSEPTHIEVQQIIDGLLYTLIVYPSGKVNYTGPQDQHPAFYFPHSYYTTFTVLSVLHPTDTIAAVIQEAESAARRAWGYWWPMEICRQVKEG